MGLRDEGKRRSLHRTEFGDDVAKRIRTKIASQLTLSPNPNPISQPADSTVRLVPEHERFAIGTESPVSGSDSESRPGSRSG